MSNFQRHSLTEWDIAQIRKVSHTQGFKKGIVFGVGVFLLINGLFLLAVLLFANHGL